MASIALLKLTKTQKEIEQNTFKFHSFHCTVLFFLFFTARKQMENRLSGNTGMTDLQELDDQWFTKTYLFIYFQS